MEPVESELKGGEEIADRYVIRKRIGAGSSGIVYLAEDKRLNRTVAIKTMRKKYAQQENSRARFSREAQVTALLKHPGVVTVYDYGENEAGLYLVMEFIEGETLGTKVKNGQCSVEKSLDWSLQIASVLAHAHALRLVHRDIKPENVFVEIHGEKEVLRVVDFGLAFIALEEESPVGRLTQEGILAGTPAYMSPEQAQGKKIGPASDIYSLGCLMYVMLTGKPPFSGLLGNVLAKHVFSTPKGISDLREGPPVPPALERLVASMLNKSAGHRPTAFEVENTLSSLSESGEVLAQTRTRTVVENHDFDGRTLNVVGIGTYEKPEELASELLRYGVAFNFVQNKSELTGNKDVDVILVRGMEAEEVGKISSETPILAQLDGDILAVVSMIRAGASDMVLGECTPSRLAAKLFRAAETAGASSR